MRFITLLTLIVFVVSCGQKFDPKITVLDIEDNIAYLASDSLKGRKPGEPGDLLAANYIRDKFEAAGLKLLFNNGFQSFSLVASAELGEGNAFGFDGMNFEVKTDYQPYAFSANTEVEASVVFAGYGIKMKRDTLQWDDFAGANVAGKWLLVLQGDTDMENANSPFLEFSSVRAKALAASDRNAAGLILVAGEKFSAKDELSSLFFDKNSSRYDIPVLQVTRKVADEMLKHSNKTIAGLEEKMLTEKKGTNLELSLNVSVKVDVQLRETETQNVAALLRGTDETLKDEYVVVGAHFDHLGMGGPGSGSRAVDTIAVHNGADDNASGVSAVIQLAEKLAAEGANKRSIIFTAFGAEEMGLVGSKAFTAKPPVEKEKMVAMFNFTKSVLIDKTRQKRYT